MHEADALLELQRADIEIMRASKRLDELPEKRRILEIRAKQREVESMHAKAELLVRKLESELKARQDEISSLAEKIEGEQAKVMETSDHRQVQSLTREMDGLKRRVDKLEMESMGFMERIEKANLQVTTVNEAVQSLAAKEADMIGQFREAGGALQREIANQQAVRDKLAKSISPSLVERYEKIRSGHGGLGVGRLEGNSCSACRMSLPAERVKELSTGPDVGECPQCRRLIVVRGGSEE
jgi:predicted  nucleic acid-binding Zn-ribbon protein